ncbi:MBL fold metallo-hydrolase [Pseudarthrobacter cellobiosi]|uniref:MBL fold metallo-hydrolase n=1 Tax=Pseudarthrobacter cellobiosi TaxID=2953654 RepID=UPI0027E2FFDD|nr:MBL fold metallo-hydrolase [Pseudarthrobacter sp. HLT1-5]
MTRIAGARFLGGYRHRDEVPGPRGFGWTADSYRLWVVPGIQTHPCPQPGTFPVPPASIDAVLLTHAHLDHTGYVPALVRDGFRGRVHAPAATTELCTLLLPDSGHLQEEEAR